MAATGIEFNLKGVATELKERLLAVPIYQRSYAWESDAIGDFWSDIRSAVIDSEPEYFLGTIVLTRQGKPPRDTIIDGQQRLATTAILLAAIRDQFRGKNDEKRANIVQEFLSTADLESATDIPRLSLNSEDAHYFEKRVINGDVSHPTSRPSHVHILAALTHFQLQLKKVVDDAGPDWQVRLNQWVNFLRSKLKAIVLEVPNEADAFLIFETLNDRGADLTIADLLKNYLFGHAGEKLDQVRDGWVLVLGALEIAAENKVFTTFLRHYWMSRHGAIRERELFKSIKSHVATGPQVVEFIVDLQNAAGIYAALLHSDHEYWDSLGSTTRENVETLLRLELEQNRPLLLSALQHFTESEKKKLLKSLVSWSVRGIVVGGIGGGTAEKVYAVAAQKIRKGEIKTASEVLAEITKIVPTDEEFRSAFEIARVPKSGVARYYLLALEHAKQGVAEPEFVPNKNEEQVNLEHILPKKASDKEWGKDFSADERRDFTYRLGNLALLQKGPNGKIGNKAFVDKQGVLQASAFAYTRQAGAEKAWNRESIRKRQVSMAAEALKIWPRK